MPECFKDDSENQWKSMENWEIWPPLSPKSPNRWLQNLVWVMMSGTPTHVQGCIWRGGIRGFDPPREVADPLGKFCRTSLGVDSNPSKSPLDSIFLLNQYNCVTNSVTFFHVIIPNSDNNRYPVPIHCMIRLWYVAVTSLLSDLFFLCYMLTPL